MAICAKNPYFWPPPRGSKRGENEFLGKKRKRHVLTLPKTKFHAKNLLRGFPGKLSERDRETERQRDRQRETDPNIRVLRTLSLSCRTKNNGYMKSTIFSYPLLYWLLENLFFLRLGPMKKLLPLFQCYPQAGRQVGKTEKGAAISSSDLILRKTGFLAVSIVRDMRKLYSMRFRIFACIAHYYYYSFKAPPPHKHKISNQRASAKRAAKNFKE